jgi:fumarylacetoacetate (FAA) hydrolase
MKFASIPDGSRDGGLVIVSRDLRLAVSAASIAESLREALERWHEVEARLQSLSDALNAGQAQGAQGFDAWRASAPLPRSPQWCESAAFLNLGRLMQKALDTPPIPRFDAVPVMARGASDHFLGPHADVQLPDEAHCIDFEGGFGVVVDDVRVGCSAAYALSRIRLVVQTSTWNLRALAMHEMNTGLGLLQSRPATSFAPVAVTPDELGPAWQNGRVHLALHVAWNGQRFGKPHGREMHFDFGELVAHAARTRPLLAASIIGSGVVSNGARGVGAACILERRFVEMLDQGKAQTGYMRFGDRVRMVARDAEVGAPFGAIDQRVVKAG